MAVFNRGTTGNFPAYEMKEDMPLPRPSVVSFVDILGYKSKVARAAAAGESNKFLTKFRQALSVASDSFKTESPCYAFNFTDSVVIGWPITNDIEVPLCIQCWNLASYQMYMSISDFFVRGGVAIGEAYFDDYVQSGRAFVDAYETEERRAIYPRIVLSEDAVIAAQISCGYSCAEDNPVNALFMVDADGEIFVNYLYSVFEDFDAELESDEIEERIGLHRDVIERNLAENEGDPAVYRKYQWAARYHDFFCDEMSKWLEHDLCIRVDYEKERFAPPRRLLEVFPDWPGRTY